jgi:autotransporter-associated beta strand protein
VNIRGAGTTYLLSQPLSNFVGNYNIDGASLRINNQNAALGVQTNPVAFSANNGTLVMRTDAAKTYNNPITINGSTAIFQHESTTAAGGNAFVQTFGSLNVVGNSSLTMNSLAVSGSNNGITGGTAGLVFGQTVLAGNLTVTVNNPAGANAGTVALGAAGGAGVSETGGSRNITKAGAGVLTLRGSSTYSGTTTVNAGTLIVSQAAAWGPALNGPGATTINAPGKLVFDYTGNVGTDPVTSIRTKLQASYASNFTTGQFRTAGDASHGLGYLDNGTSNVLLRYTYFGDANLDGQVNTADFSALAAAFNSASGTWQTGDFNYDGVVNAIDFNLLASDFGLTPIPGEPLGGQSLGALVPEPASLSLVGLGAMALLGRRRRK